MIEFVIVCVIVFVIYFVIVLLGSDPLTINATSLQFYLSSLCAERAATLRPVWQPRQPACFVHDNGAGIEGLGYNLIGVRQRAFDPGPDVPRAWKTADGKPQGTPFSNEK